MALQKRKYLARARSGYLLLLIDGALVLGFVSGRLFFVSINPFYEIAIIMLLGVIIFAYVLFYKKQIQWRVLPAILLTAGVLSLVFVGETGNPLWAIPFWLPIILMYLLRHLHHPLVDRIRRSLFVSSLVLFFLALGLTFGMHHATPVYQIFQVSVTLGHMYFLFLAFFLVLTIALYLQKDSVV